jgi:long-chain acyl-CoA synthetase
MRRLESFPNLVAMFFARARENGDAPFLWAKNGGEWRATSWREAAQKVAGLATALKELGLVAGDRVMLISENRPEWLISDLAVMAAGCVSVPTYTTNTERDHQHILDDSGARALIVSTRKLAKPLLPAAIRANALEHVIAIEPLGAGQSGAVQFHDWAALAGTKADVAACAAGATFARGPRLRHLHLGHRRCAARGDAASRRDPPQCRGLRRADRRRFRLGGRDFPLLPPRLPRL